MLQGRDITVIGGGVAGLASALALARQGAAVTVLEQAPGISELGAGIQISPNGAVVLRALGLGESLRTQAVPAGAVDLRNGADGRSVLTLDLASARHPGGYWFVHRADLIAMLERAARDAGVRLRLMQRVTTIEDDGTAAVLCNAQGAAVRAEIVVAADGLHSVGRAMLGGAGGAFFTGQVAWRAVIPEAGDAAPVAEVHMGPGRHLVSYPLRDGRARNIVAVEERADWTEESWYLRDDPANLRRAFAGFGGRVTGWLDRVETVNLWGLFRHPVAPRWSDGRHVVLAGDAAHPTLPFMAQGANMALEDAWVLAAALDAHADDPPRAFAAYQNARHARARRIVDAAGRNARMYHLRAPLRPVAHAVLRLGDRIAPRAALRRFDWLYGHDVTRQDV